MSKEFYHSETLRSKLWWNPENQSVLAFSPATNFLHLCMLNCVVGTDIDIDVAGYVRWTSVAAARILAMLRWLEIGEVQSNNKIKVKMAVMMRLFVLRMKDEV
ncbi:unnamed protein product [Vicia faba]|uniref:Uncharacterized protein n=1 Tax=Vicia faba TaxID=3906 RepID=A0AAV1B5F1_VICFA|nr:unnamed protein product [Vicia faba]